jgi:EAL domain-containing protein (putative c-di-GMP-specific phosphodiesterase class I)
MTKKGALASSPRRVVKKPAQPAADRPATEPIAESAPGVRDDAPEPAPVEKAAAKPVPKAAAKPSNDALPETAEEATVASSVEAGPAEAVELPALESFEDIVFESLGDITTEALIDPGEQARLAEARRRVEQLPVDGSIRVAFQPIVDLATKKVIGYEALARFPGDANVSTRTWFAEAAEVGLLREIEMLAIRTALGQLEKLPLDAFISVNVSPGTAASDELRDALEDVDGSRVVLEINENAAAEGYDEVSEAVGALRSNGVRIALDDTGSGTVSFSSLFDVHADIIKIDIDVTHGIDTDPMKEAMASALKSLADRLGAMSLAEGIETEQELELLREVGVQAGQGYLFGRPESVSD